MKNRFFITPISALILGSVLVVSAQADTVDVSLSADINNNAYTLNVNGENGKAYIYTTSSDAGAAFRFLSNSPYSYNTINVAEGVDAVMNFSTTDIDGYKSTKEQSYHAGGSNGLTKGSTILVDGGGADSSSFTFYGSNFRTGGVESSGTGSEGTVVEDTITISDITFDFNGTGGFGTNKVVLQNSVVNLNSGKLFSGTKLIKSGDSTVSVNKIVSTSLDNSTYNIKSTTVTSLGDLGATTLTNNSNLNVENGSVSATTLSVSSSNVKVANGATLNLSGANAFTIADMNQIKVEKGGTLNASASTITLIDGGEYTLSGGSYNISRFAGGDNKSSKVYVTAESLTTSGMGNSGQTSARTYIVGYEKNGNAVPVEWIANNGFQLNQGGKIVLVNGSSLYSSSKVNFADTTAYNASANIYDGTFNYIEKGTEIRSSVTRINGGYFDGKITVNKGYEANSDWNYTFALGVKAQGANVTLGGNAEIIVYGATSVSDTSGEVGKVGKLFTISGNITSNAGTGKIVSDANAGFFIKSKDANTKTVLTLNTTDAFKVGGAESQGTSTFELEAGANVEFVINADNNIGTVALGSSASKLLLTIADGKVLTIGSFANLANSDALSVALGDTAFGSLRITDMDSILANYASNSAIKFTDADGVERILGDNLFIKEIESGVFTVSTVIPEPAEWAMIFGAIALAFVAYRRRK